MLRDVQITMSASTTGEISNRIKVGCRKCGKMLRAHNRSGFCQEHRNADGYRKPRAVASIVAKAGGGRSSQVALSITEGDVARIDAWCERVQMGRSEFIRRACDRFIAYLEDPRQHRGENA